MTHYLVDYENVHEGGLKGIRNLKGDCTVHIFYTQNACKIKMDTLIVPDNVMLHFVQVSAGKQQADMHLISYLGFLIGQDKKDQTYIIVSRDHDYDKTISFWNERAESYKQVSRQECIDYAHSQEIPKKESTRVYHKPAAEGTTEIRFERQEAKAKQTTVHLTTKGQKVLAGKMKEQGLKWAEAEFVVNTMLRYKFSKNYKQKVQDEIIHRYGQKKGKQIYWCIRRLLPKQSDLAKIA